MGLTALLIANLANCLADAGPSLPAAPVSTELSILYTGDTYGFHGRKGLPGGFAKRQAAVEKIRAKEPNNLLLDSGNSLGQIYYSRFDRGELAAAHLASLGYDAVNLGTHEFDYGSARLADLAARDHLPLVSTNVVTAEGTPVTSTQIDRTVGGIRVAILGVCDERVAQMTMVGAFAGLKALSPLEALRKHVAAAHADHDVIIVLANVGYYESVRLAREIPDIDVIISRSRLGGSEYDDNQESEPLESSLLTGPQEKPHQTLVVVASRYGYFLGHIKMTMTRQDAGFKVTQFDSSPVAMSADAEENPETAARIQQYVEGLRRHYGRVLVSHVRETYGGRLTASAFHDVLLTAMRTRAKAEISVINVGAFSEFAYTLDQIREADEIREFDVQRLMWTDDTLAKTVMTGEQLSHVVDAASDNLAFSGLHRQDGKLVVNGRPIDAKEKYAVATSNFLVSKDSEAPTLAVGDVLALPREKTPVVLRDLMLEAIAESAKGLPAEDPYPGQWRVRFDQISIDYSDLTVRRSSDLTKATLVRDIRTTASSHQLTTAYGRIGAQYDGRSLDWNSELESRYMSFWYSNHSIVNWQDLLRLESGLYSRSLAVWKWTPGLDGTYLTDFTPSDDTPRNHLFRVVPALQLVHWGPLRRVMFGPAWEIDASRAQTNQAVGLYALYRLDQTLSSRIRATSDFELRYLPWYRFGRDDSLWLAAEIRGQLMVRLFGDFSVGPNIYYFVYGVKTINGVGQNFQWGFTITYDRLWKPETESFL
jgi:2',3'-cyclic-nucleotide 2'-phosphodiesterase (5'-nucleotidase family)